MAANLRTWLQEWDSQPEIDCEANAANGYEVLFAVSGRSPVDVVQQRALKPVGSGVGNTSVGGLGKQIDTSTTGLFQVNSPRVPSSVVGCALLFAGSWESTAATLLSFGQIASFGGFFSIAFDAGPLLTATYRGRNGGSTTARRSSIGGARTNYVVVAHITAANNIDMYVNGELDNGALTSSAGTDNPLWTTAAIGGLVRDTAAYSASKAMGALYAGLRNVTSPMAAELSKNPWQILAPRRIIVPVAAAGATVPALSSLTTTNITTTTATLGLTLAF